MLPRSTYQQKTIFNASNCKLRILARYAGSYRQVRWAEEGVSRKAADFGSSTSTEAHSTANAFGCGRAGETQQSQSHGHWDDKTNFHKFSSGHSSSRHDEGSSSLHMEKTAKASHSRELTRTTESSGGGEGKLNGGLEVFGAKMMEAGSVSIQANTSSKKGVNWRDEGAAERQFRQSSANSHKGINSASGHLSGQQLAHIAGAVAGSIASAKYGASWGNGAHRSEQYEQHGESFGTERADVEYRKQMIDYNGMPNPLCGPIIVWPGCKAVLPAVDITATPVEVVIHEDSAERPLLYQGPYNPQADDMVFDGHMCHESNGWAVNKVNYFPKAMAKAHDLILQAPTTEQADWADAVITEACGYGSKFFKDAVQSLPLDQITTLMKLCPDVNRKMIAVTFAEGIMPYAAAAGHKPQVVEQLQKAIEDGDGADIVSAMEKFDIKALPAAPPPADPRSGGSAAGAAFLFGAGFSTVFWCLVGALASISS